MDHLWGSASLPSHRSYLPSKARVFMVLSGHILAAFKYLRPTISLRNLFNCCYLSFCCAPLSRPWLLLRLDLFRQRPTAALPSYLLAHHRLQPPLNTFFSFSEPQTGHNAPAMTLRASKMGDNYLLSPTTSHYLNIHVSKTGAHGDKPSKVHSDINISSPLQNDMRSNTTTYVLLSQGEA